MLPTWFGSTVFISMANLITNIVVAIRSNIPRTTSFKHTDFIRGASDEFGSGCPRGVFEHPLLVNPV